MLQINKHATLTKLHNKMRATGNARASPCIQGRQRRANNRLATQCATFNQGTGHGLP